MSNNKTLFVLGGSGFIGRALIKEAVAAGWAVRALARSESALRIVCEAGATAVPGDAENPEHWIESVVGTSVIVDLVQPARTRRITRSSMRRMAKTRQRYTGSFLDSLNRLAEQQKPRLVSVSGIDDLAPDPSGYVSTNSPLRDHEYGFNSIGIPVRKLIEKAEVSASFVYLGAVYGDGSVFGKEIFPAVRSGSWKNFGGRADRLVLIHVDDVARGLLEIAGLPTSKALRQSFVLVDNEPASMEDFIRLAAELMHVRTPGKVPSWMASLVAGKPIVETTLHRERFRSDCAQLLGVLRFPSYREGVPASIKNLHL